MNELNTEFTESSIESILGLVPSSGAGKFKRRSNCDTNDAGEGSDEIPTHNPQQFYNDFHVLNILLIF